MAVLGVQVHSDLTQLLEEVRRDQPMGLLLARAGVSREVRGGIISHNDNPFAMIIPSHDHSNLCDHEDQNVTKISRHLSI